MKHDVAEHIDSFLYMLGLDGTIEDGVLFVREGIQLTANALNGIDNLNGTATLGTLERQMLAEMGQSLLAWLLMACAGFDGDAAVHNLRI